MGVSTLVYWFNKLREQLEDVFIMCSKVTPLILLLHYDNANLVLDLKSPLLLMQYYVLFSVFVLAYVEAYATVAYLLLKVLCHAVTPIFCLFWLFAINFRVIGPIYLLDSGLLFIGCPFEIVCRKLHIFQHATENNCE